MKKFLALILAIIMALSAAACGNDADKPDSGNTDPAQGDSGKTPDSGGTDSDTLNVAVSTDAGTLSPALIGTGTYGIVAQIQEPLWDVTEDGDVVYILCESVEFVSDTEQILHLRKGVKFHNGNPFTASDVVFSMKLHAESGFTGTPRVQTVDLENTKAIDEYTVELHLIAPTICNWTVLSQCFIYDEESYDEAQAASSPIGTGPYKFVSYVPNSELNCERNEEYWGEKPDFKYLNCKILAEASQRVNALETGLIDVGQISIADHDYVSRLDTLNVIGDYTGNFCALMFNFGENSAFYKNADARRAIVHATDREAILNTVYLGLGKLMQAVVVDYCFDFEDRFNDISDTHKLGFDTELARSLAESSGLAGKTITILTDGTTDNIRTAEMLQGMYSQIGVTLEIQSYDSATLFTMMYDPAAEWDMFVGLGMAPNRRCGDQLLNGVRYFETMKVPGAFENNEEYLELAPLCMSLQDEKELSDMLYKMMKWYDDEVLSFSMFDIEAFNVVSNKIDPESVVLSAGTSFIRYSQLKKAG